MKDSKSSNEVSQTFSRLNSDIHSNTTKNVDWLTIGLSATAGVGLYFLSSWTTNYLSSRKSNKKSWPFGYLVNNKKSTSFNTNKSTNQSTDQSTNQSNNQSTNQSNNQSNNQSTNQSTSEDKDDNKNLYLPTHKASEESFSRSTQYSLELAENSNNKTESNYNKKNLTESEDERSDIPENAPDSCPGVYSENAGFSESCDGCPNQRLCASGDAKKPDPALVEGLKKLDLIKHKILILSGKGGVGKSTVSSQIAWALQRRGFEVGLLDIDICGPSIPRMTGTIGRDVHLSLEGWSPIYVEDNLAVMSIGFLLPEDDDAVIWRGPKKNALIRQFLTDVTWGPMDFLIIDTPPGTSDEHLSIVTFLKESGIDGAVVITTPQEMALQDVRKEINFCKKGNIPVLGVIENMTNSIFSANTGGAKRMSQLMSVPYIGSLSMDKMILKATEMGVGVESLTQTSSGFLELSKILDTLLTILNEPLIVQDN